MNEADAKEIVDKIVGQVFGYKNPYSLEDFMKKFAFDVRLPNKVSDSYTGEDTWAQSTNPTKFMTQKNASVETHKTDWMRPKRPISSLEDVLEAWNEINFTTTERMIECIDVAQSDNIYNSEKIFRSQDCHFSKYLIYCDGVRKSEYLVASQRSFGSVYSIRVEDSAECSESFGVSWSGKISKSFMIHDSYDLSDCILCSHIKSKRFCIANIQFEEDEYKKLKDIIIKWILS